MTPKKSKNAQHKIPDPGLEPEISEKNAPPGYRLQKGTTIDAYERFTELLPLESFRQPGELSLLKAASDYLEECGGTQSPNTVQAKKRDLTAFLKWYYDANGHLAVEDWLTRDTQGFLNHLEHELGRSPATVNRALATLRHFARWIQDSPQPPFVGGLPTKGIRELHNDELDAQKLSRREVNQLFKAADRLVLTETRKNGRPQRNAAILALLYYTGLRVSELCALTMEQYDGKHLLHIKRKGKERTNKLYVSTDCRRYLDEYIETERAGVPSEWLFPSANSEVPINRSTVWRILERLAQEATKHTKSELKLYPHRLRHTFGSDIREKTGSDSETARLLGHTSIKYVGRYTRATDQEREELLESRGRPTSSPEPEPLTYSSEKELRQDSNAELYEREIAAYLATGNVTQKALAAFYKTTTAHIRAINQKLKARKIRLSPEEIQTAKRKGRSLRGWFEKEHEKNARRGW